MSRKLSLEEGVLAVKYARGVVEETVTGSRVMEVTLPGVFEEKKGAFVTINTYPSEDLRGCIGVPYPVMSLKDAIAEGASSAVNDPRFSPLRTDELNRVLIEVTVLTAPEPINVDKPEDYLSQIKIGRDGLIVEMGFNKGLLLPQVPVEQGWDVEEFLSHTCMKAGLLPDAWFEKNIKVSRFSGQIFSETEPRGKVKEKKIKWI